MEGMKYTAIIHEAEEGGYWAEVPDLPGCFTQGETLDETKSNVIEAAQCWLEAQIAPSFDYSIRPLRRQRLSSRRAPRRREAALA